MAVQHGITSRLPDLLPGDCCGPGCFVGDMEGAMRLRGHAFVGNALVMNEHETP